jgi:hypothetical protein
MRSIIFFRRGQNASGAVSLQAFDKSPDRVENLDMSDVNLSMALGDYLRTADILEQKFLPNYKP